MGLLDENISHIAAQKCPSCEDGVVIKDRFNNLSCTVCPMRLSAHGQVRGWSLKKTVKEYNKKKKKTVRVV